MLADNLNRIATTWARKDERDRLMVLALAAADLLLAAAHEATHDMTPVSLSALAAAEERYALARSAVDGVKVAAR